MTRSITAQALARAAGRWLILDVRLAEDFEADPAMIEGAERRLPGEVEQWWSALAPDRPVVVYCVKGAHVCQTVHAALAAKGVDVRYLEGGIRAWKAAGGKLATG